MPGLRRVSVLATLVGLLAMLGVACGAEPTPTPTPTPRPVATPTPTPKPLETLTVGIIDLYTGGSKFIADSIKAGMEIALEEANAAGGVAGYKLELTAVDMAGSTEKAVTEARRMVLEQNIKYVNIGIHSGAAVALAQLAKEQKNFLVNAAFATSKRLTGEAGSRYAARANISTVEIGGSMAEFLKDHPEVKTVATISPDYEYGQHLVKDFKARLAQVRPDIRVVREEWPALGTADMTAHVTALQAMNPDVVFTGVFGGDLINFLKAAKDFGLTPGARIFTHGLDLVKMESMKDILPEGTWGTVWYPFWDITGAASDDFVAKYKAKMNDIPVAGSLVGYYAGKMLAEAIKKAGSADLERVLDTLDGGFDFEGPAGTVSVRGCDHMALGPFFLGEVKLGAEYPGGIGVANVVSVDTKGIARSCEDIAAARAGQ